MRYVALILLVLLSIYFLLFKPYTLKKGITYRVEGFSLQLFPLKFHIDKFLVSLPYGRNHYFLHLQDLSFILRETPKLHLKEGILAIRVVERAKRKKSRELPEFIIPEIIKVSEIRIGRFAFIYESKRIMSVLLEGLSLKNRRIRVKAYIHLNGRDIEADLRKAYLGRSRVNVEDLEIRSDMFNLTFKGFLEERERMGIFRIEGRYFGLHTPYVRIAPIKLRGRGRLSYEKLNAELDAYTEEVEIKGKKTFKNLTSHLKLDFGFKNGLRVEGDLRNEDIYGTYRLELGLKRFLSVRIERFPVDSELLSISPLMIAWVRGDFSYNFIDRNLELNLSTDGLILENLSFGRAYLRLAYSLKRSEGDVELLVSNPGTISLHGKVEGKKFLSKLRVEDLFLIRDRVSLFLSYNGELAYDEKLSLRGKGRFRDLFYSDFFVGDGIYSVKLFGNDIDLRYSGTGFRGFLRGDIKEGFVSLNDLRNFTRVVGDTEIRVEEGDVQLSVDKGRFALAVSVKRGGVKKGNLKIDLRGDLNLKKREGLSGEVKLIGDRILIGRKSFKGAYLEGKIKGWSVDGSYRVADILKGTFSFEIEERRLLTKGFARLNPFEVVYGFSGTPERGKLKGKARIKVGGKEIVITARAGYKGKKLWAEVDPFKYEYGTVLLEFGGVNLKGNTLEADLETRPLKVSILGKPVVTIIPVGKLSVEKRNASIVGNFQGAIRGNLEILYSQEQGFSVKSSGDIKLEELSFFTATPLGGRALGDLNYRFSLDERKLKLELRNSDKVVLYSKYLSLPMNLWVELKAIERQLSAFITVWKDSSGMSVNVGSLNLKDYYVYLLSRDLPVLYRGEGILAMLRVSSEGWIDVKSAKEVNLRLDALLSGEVEIKKVEKRREKERKRKVPLKLDVRFESGKPVKVRLPEGFVYVNVMGWVGGEAQDPQYSLRVEFLSGELTYFGRTFFIKKGSLRVIREKEIEERIIDISLVNPSEDGYIFINLRGYLENPDLIVWSEPPRSTQEILTKLIIGSTAEGIIPVAQTLFRQFGYIGEVRKGLASLLGVEINFSTQIGAQGEIGLNVNVKKKIARALSVEYQQSTLRDPRATYYGGSVLLPGGLSFYGRVFSNRTSELKLRFIRKFDF